MMVEHTQWFVNNLITKEIIIIMKKIYKSVGALVLSGMMFLACSDDDHTGLSTINYSAPTVTLSSSENNVTVSETDIEDAYTITVTASITEAVPVNIYVPLVQTGGSASADDFSAGTITIPAGSLSGLTTVDVYQTGDIEGDETLTVGPGDVVANANVSPFSLTVNITDDYVNSILDLELNWDGEVTVEEDFSTQTFDFCGMDFDILIFDSAFNNTGVYDGATSACPEHVPFGDLADGDYYIVADLYDNPYSALAIGEPVPVTLSWNQEFVGTSGSITNLDFTTDSSPGMILLAVITKDGYNYTVTPQ